MGVWPSPWLRVLNAFQARKVSVNLGYNKRAFTTLNSLTLRLLELMKLHGGEEAANLIRRHAAGFDLAFTAAVTHRKSQKGLDWARRSVG